MQDVDKGGEEEENLFLFDQNIHNFEYALNRAFTLLNGILEVPEGERYQIGSRLYEAQRIFERVKRDIRDRPGYTGPARGRS